MRDPKRLLNGELTGFERLLLHTAANERLSPESRFRMRHALGLPAIVATVAVKAAALTWGQTALIAVVAAGLMGTSSSSLEVRERPMVVNSVKAQPAKAAPGAPRVREPARLQPSEVGTNDQPPAVGSPVKTSAKRRVASHATPPPENPVSATSEVREEIQLLDQARTAVRAEAPERALERLARYAERFPRGVFRQEAMVLRIEALRQRGDRGRAATLARQFLAEHPESPHAQRVSGSATSTQSN
jgi:TolA-binding protein